jgi:esterase
MPSSSWIDAGAEGKNRAGASTQPVSADQCVTLSDGAAIHFIERGTGHPLILLHGGVGDMRSWTRQIVAFSDRYRTISYSRRHSFPNVNPFAVPRNPAAHHANDLLDLMNALRIDRAHLVGSSYGALVALMFALRWESRVTTLSLSEPPMHGWLADLPGGPEAHDRFHRDVWANAARKFRNGRPKEAMGVLSAAFGIPPNDAESADDDLATRSVRAMMWLVLAEEPFPNLDRVAVRNLAIPTLIIQGERSDLIHTLGAGELARVLKRVSRATLQGVGHRVPIEDPEGFNRVVLNFLHST